MKNLRCKPFTGSQIVHVYQMKRQVFIVHTNTSTVCFFFFLVRSLTVKVCFGTCLHTFAGEAVRRDPRQAIFADVAKGGPCVRAGDACQDK